MVKVDYFKIVVGFLILIVSVQVSSFCGKAWAGKKGVTQEGPLLPNALIRLPLGEHAVIVEKSTQRLTVFAKGETMGYETVMTVPCSTGEISGMKEKAGDKKTPEGVYFCLDEYKDRYLSPVYGKKAFPTDYPNAVDQLAGRNGSAIWLHGTNKRLRSMDSNGCVAMKNDDILKLSDYIRLFATPVIMVEKISNISQQKIEAEGARLFDLIQGWAKAIEKGDYHDYLAFYDSAYLPSMTWWNQWRKLQQETMGKGVSFEVFFENMGMYKNKDIFVLVFDIGLNLAEWKSTVGKRQLFIRKQAGLYTIIGERFPFGKDSKKKKDSKKGVEDPLVASGKKMVQDLGIGFSIEKVVDAWLKAWSSENLDAYSRFYAKDFISDGLDKKEWVARKRWLAGKYRFIKVTGRDFKIDKEMDQAVVTFSQDYRSSGFAVRGKKHLILVKREGVWKIYRESWKES